MVFHSSLPWVLVCTLPAREDQTELSGNVKEALYTLAFQLVCPPEQASQEGELQRGPPETLVAIPRFPIREELVMGAREDSSIHPHPSPAVWD